MNVGLVTIVALLLLLPGIGFIVGVNTADKNVREIVFRNTPAEFGYVIFVSVIVHLVFALFPHVNFAQIYMKYAGIVQIGNTPANPPQLEVARRLFALSLFYFLATAIVGFAPGLLLGYLVRMGADYAYKGYWRWVLFFVKHRWMVGIIPRDETSTIYARILLSDEKSATENDHNYPVIIEGLVRDCYFDANGTLLYIVFRTFSAQGVNSTRAPYLDILLQQPGSSPASTPPVDQLVVEGRKVAMARYYRASSPLPLAAMEALPVPSDDEAETL
jgi:hypothetical protein